MYGKNLKIIRTHLKATQEKMAEMMNIPLRTYVSYERNENNPPYSMLVTLCKNFNVNLNWFIAGIGEPFSTPKLDTVREELRHEVLQILKEEGVLK